MKKFKTNYSEQKETNPHFEANINSLNDQSIIGNQLIEYPSIIRSKGRSKSTPIEAKLRSTKIGNGGVDSVQDHYHYNHKKSLWFPEPPFEVFIPKITALISPNPNGPNTGGMFINFGPAHYNTEEQRFYCYVNCIFKNKLSSSVTTMQKVTCKVSKNGNEIMNFDFNLYQYTISPGEEKSINFYIYLEKDSAGYNVLKNYGDIRLDFVFESSEGNLIGWNIWGAMAQIKINSIFVGNYQYAEMTDVQSLIENEVSAIFGNHGLFISESRISSIMLPYLATDGLHDSRYADTLKYKDLEFTYNNTDPSDFGRVSIESDELRVKYGGPANFLDIFFVESFSATESINMPKTNNMLGFSPRPGSIEKNNKRSGIIIQRRAITQWQRLRNAQAIAHEIGHYLGLPHVDVLDFQSKNLMAPRNHMYVNRTMLTRDQVETMLQHGFVEPFDSVIIA